jgi:hypothetical protein
MKPWMHVIMPVNAGCLPVCFGFDKALQGAVIHPPRDDHMIEGGAWVDPQSYERQNVIVLDACPGEHSAIEHLLEY